MQDEEVVDDEIFVAEEEGEVLEEDEDGELNDEDFEEDWEDWEDEDDEWFYYDEDEEVVVRENGIICKSWYQSDEWFYSSYLDIVIDSEQLNFRNRTQPM